jgi:anti-anti-sigma factor
MNFTVDKQGTHTVIALHVDKLDSNVSPALKSQFVLLNAEGVKNVIVDLSETKYCDSSGLSAILVGNRLAKDVSGTFVITGLQNSVMKLIQISQLDSVLNILPSVLESVDFVKMEEVERDIDNDTP